MKKLFSFLLIVIIPAFALAQDHVIKDANAQQRTVGHFHAISVSSAFDLYLTQSDQEAVAVSADKEKYVDRIITVVEDGVLKIKYEQEGRWWHGDGGKKLKAYVSFKALDKLKVSGASDVYVEGAITTDELELRLSGASDFKKGVIITNSLSVSLSGASRAYVTGGSAARVNVDASGASDFHGFDLKTDNCRANASGASTIRITVQKELTAKASGASGVHYKGDGVITNIKTSGASSISRKS